MNPRPPLDPRFLPKFKADGNLLKASSLVPVNHDMQLRSVPDAVKTLQPNIFAQLLETGMKFTKEAALQHQLLLEAAVLHLRLYASLCYMQPGLVERMVTWYVHDGEKSRMGWETLALRKSIENDDPEIMQYLAQKNPSQLQTFECVMPAVQTPGMRTWDVMTSLLTTTLIGAVTLRFMLTEATRVVQYSVVRTLMVRDLKPVKPAAYETLVPLVPLINHAEFDAATQAPSEPRLKETATPMFSLPATPPSAPPVLASKPELPMIGLPLVAPAAPQPSAEPAPAVPTAPASSPMAGMLPSGAKLPIPNEPPSDSLLDTDLFAPAANQPE